MRKSKPEISLNAELENAAKCIAQGKPGGCSALGIGTCGDIKPGEFKEWLKLQEVGTGTNAVAMFKRPIFAEPFRRSALAPWGEEDPFFKKRKKNESREIVKGGLADSRPDSDFDQDQLAAGIKIEMEHTNDPKVAKEIAKDHLSEDKDYYLKLTKIEKHESFRATSSLAQTLPQGDQPTLQMPFMKKKAKK